jgi:hypothetical protein
MKMNAYKYWIDLVDSIEKYTTNKVNKNKNHFYYDGLDFTAAFERSLYFEIFGNTRIYNNCIIAIKSTDNIMYVDSLLQKEIFLVMLKNYKVKLEVRLSNKNRLKIFIYRNKYFINAFLKLRNKDFIGDNTLASSAFVIIHHKFIRYLTPIFNELKNSVFIICDDFLNSIELCKKNNYHYIVLNQNAQLARKAHNDIVGLTIQYETIKSAISKIKPKNIIIPEGNSPLNELFNLVTKKEKKIKTICIQQGWSPVVHNGFRKMNYDLFLTWGGEFSNILSRYNKEQKFLVVGNHILDLQKNEVVKNYISFFPQGVDSVITQKDSDDFFELAIYIANKYNNLQVIIREHPSTPIDTNMKSKLINIKNIKFMNSDKYALSAVLSKTKIAISVFSTVLYESLLYDAIPFSFNSTDLPGMEPNLCKLGVGIESKSILESKNKIDYILNNNLKINLYLKNILKYKKNYFYNNGDGAIKNIVMTIKRENKFITPKPMDFIKKV